MEQVQATPTNLNITPIHKQRITKPTRTTIQQQPAAITDKSLIKQAKDIILV